MKSIFQIILCATLVVCVSACKKESRNFGTPITPGPYASLFSMYADLAVEAKTYYVDAATGGTFFGPQGSRFTFPAGGFITPTGQPVSGTVQVSVKEIISRGDMILSRVLPISNGEPLYSGGMAWVHVSQNGNTLLMQNGKTFEVHLPQKFGQAAPGLGLFLGEANDEIPGNGVNWNQADSLAAGRIVYNGDTIGIISDSVGWCNADMFLSNPNYQDFTVNITGVTLPAQSSTGSPGVIAYALYDDYRGLWPMSQPQENVISEDHVPKIPVHFVVFTIVDGHFYGGITAATPENGKSYTVNLSQTDPVSFKAQVDAL